MISTFLKLAIKQDYRLARCGALKTISQNSRTRVKLYILILLLLFHHCHIFSRVQKLIYSKCLLHHFHNDCKLEILNKL